MTPARTAWCPCRMAASRLMASWSAVRQAKAQLGGATPRGPSASCNVQHLSACKWGPGWLVCSLSLETDLPAEMTLSPPARSVPRLAV